MVDKINKEIPTSGGGARITIIDGSVKSEPPPKQKTSNFGKLNKLVTEEAYKKARERMLKKRGIVRSGIDPEDLVDGATIATYYMEGGIRQFPDDAKVMVDDLGDWECFQSRDKPEGVCFSWIY